MKKIVIFVAALAIMVVVLVVARKPPVGPSVDPNNPVQPQKTYTFQEALDSIQQNDLKQIVTYLASDELEGRMSGMTGNERSADFVIGKFREMGLKPACTGYRQTFEVEKMNEFKEKSTGHTSNVIGYLDGNDPKVRDETIVVGSHFDHISFGPAMSRTPNRREIHNGADDNASGVGAMMGAAQAVCKLKGQNHRRIVFIGFSAEEMGLIGSKHYVKNSLLPNMKLMVNLDMIGRYKNNGNVGALGGKSLSQINTILNDGASKLDVRMRATEQVGGGSDQAPFAAAGIPAVFFHTGTHKEYHTPDDDVSLIDFDGVEKVSKLLFYTVWNADKLPQINKTQVKQTIPAKFEDHGSSHDR